MRGLAFPTNTVIDREASYEYGTPISNVDEIPIDPALMIENSSTNFVQASYSFMSVMRDAS